MCCTKIRFLTFAKNPLDIKNLQAKDFFFFYKRKESYEEVIADTQK